MELNVAHRSRSVAACLEADWLWEHRHALARRCSAAAWVLGGCWVLFVAMDLLTLAPALRGSIVEIEVALGLFVVPSLVWLSRRPALAGMPLAVTALLAIVGLGIEAKMGAIAAAGGMLRYDGLLLYVLGVYVLAGLSWRAAFSVGVATGAGWALLVWSCELEREVMTSVYLACANVIGLTNTRLTERLHRESFQRRVMVEQERLRVQSLADALAVQSLHDELTGLPNRRSLAQDGERLWESVRREERLLLVAMVDVDHFKAYNDRLGHPAGDEVLRQVGSALRSVAAGDGELAFRYGGEEFTILWAVDDPSEATFRAQRLHAAVAALAIPHPSSSVGAMLTVSVGLAVCCAARTTLSQAVAEADSLLYEAKRAGRSCTQLSDRSLALVS